MQTPLLQFGTFGTHAIQCSGIWSFTGMVPHDIKRGGFPDEQAAVQAFANWFVAQDEPFQREHLTNLRDDVLDAVFCGAWAATA